MIKNHPVITALVLILVIGGLFLVLRPSQATTTQPEKAQQQPKEERKLPVEVSVAKKGSISSSLITTATLDPERQVTMLSETQGIVQQLTVDEGDRVSEGQVLVRLSDRDKMAALEKADSHVQNATAEMQRKQASFDQKLISMSDYDKAKYDLDLAKAEKNAAQVELTKTVLRAPFSGIITQRFVEKGQNINSQSQLFALVDSDPLKARIYLPEKEVFGIHENQQVDLALNAQKDVQFTGVIKQINPAVDPRTGTIKVTIDVTNPPPQVRPGSFVDVQLITQRHDNALLIPKKALIEEAGEQYVFLINKDLAARRTVTVGFVDDQNAEILTGIKQGDSVVIAGQGSLRDGSKTEIVANK